MAFKKQVFGLIKLWCDRLIATQLDMNDEPLLDGGMLCPACAVIHGRCADAVFPLVLLYKETGEEKYLISAKKAVEWTERNLLTVNNDYRNDISNRWKGTNIFFCLSLGETLHRFKDVLDSETFDRWDHIFRRNTEASIGFCEKIVPHINYNAGAAALFAFAYNYTGNEKYLAEAVKWEKFCRNHIDGDGLIYGEGHPTDGITEKGCRYIDMGYNMEETLPLLIMHSVWMKDGEKIKFYTQRVIDHIAFIMPDGGVDNSWGTRQNKWTYWGSRTSDGMHEGFALVAKNNPIIAKAVRKNVELLEKCTVDGRLYGGKMYYSAEEPACIHHAFNKAKSLAVLYCEMGDEYECCESAILPREKDGVKSYQKGNLLTVTKGDFIATVNACDTAIYSGSETGGGAISLLYHKKYGAVLVATPTSFYPTEPMNMQLQRHSDEELCFTARVGNSDRDKSVVLNYNGYTVTAKGKDFKAEYEFAEHSVKIAITAEKDEKYILPIISQKGDTVDKSEGQAVFGKILSLTADSDFKMLPEGEKRYFHPVGGFQYKYTVFEVKAGKRLNIEIKTV